MEGKEWVTCNNCGRPKHIDKTCACELEEIITKDED